jgi:glycosyltransferase involved in cell wall biosynthesis
MTLKQISLTGSHHAKSEATPPSGVAPSYLIVVPVPAMRVGQGQFAIESAFAEHVRLLRSKLGQIASNLVIAGPGMDEADYERNKSSLQTIDESRAGIRFVPLFPASIGRLKYLKALPSVLRILHQEVSAARVVHTGPSLLYRMFEFPAFLLAVRGGKTTIGVSDVDERNNPWMNLKTGVWSRRQYWTNRLIHGFLMHLQHKIIARRGSLVLYKGNAFARDYGLGRPHVKNFLDSAFTANDIIPADRLDHKLDLLTDPATTLEICYFGRLVAYKGVDHMLAAVAHAKGRGLANFRFHIIGNGDQRDGLMKRAETLGLASEVIFSPAVPFGPPLFSRLHTFHILLAAPLSEDTPRSALDTMASGQAICAYDTYYYRDLRDAGAGVNTVPWLDASALGDMLFRIATDRAQLGQQIRKSVQFAQRNTQEEWLERRVRWTREAIEAERPGCNSERGCHSLRRYHGE